MAWVRLDDAFPEHPKVLAAGGDAAWLYVCALTYSNRFLTDGFIPSVALARLSDRRRPIVLACRLAEVGLFDRVDGGWMIHDFLTYQTSRTKVEEERDRARERMANNRARFPNVRANTERSSEEVRTTPSTAQAHPKSVNGFQQQQPSEQAPLPNAAAAAIELILDIKRQATTVKHPVPWTAKMRTELASEHTETMLDALGHDPHLDPKDLVMACGFTLVDIARATQGAS